MNKYLQFDEQARGLLLKVFNNSLDQVKLPVDLIKIAQDLGLETYSFDDPQWSYISGAYDRNKRAIYVNGFDPPERQAFTLAHEIAHYYLHGNQEYDVLYRTDSIKYDNEVEQKESEANAFASSLLMPRSLVKQYWLLNPKIDYIASTFGVSQTAAYYRLNNLGLLE